MGGGASLAEDEVVEESLFEEVGDWTPECHSVPHPVSPLHPLYPHTGQPLPEDPGDEAVAGVEDVPGGLTVQDVSYLGRVKQSRSEITYVKKIH